MPPLPADFIYSRGCKPNLRKILDTTQELDLLTKSSVKLAFPCYNTSQEGWTMMGRQSGQISMLILDIEELIPENHLFRKINQMISFDFIYDLVASYYPDNGRPSVDPISMFKMLLVGYLYGIKSNRRLVQEIQLNIAYR